MDFSLIKAKKGTIFSIVILAALLTGVFTFVQPLKYGAESKLLVIQNFPAGADAYSVSRANEYLGGLLADVVSSRTFYDEVMESGFSIDKKYFSSKGDRREEIKNWKKTVKAVSVGDKGIININIYHVDSVQADQIARAVNYVLKTKNQNYHGIQSGVSVKVIDNPIVSSFPIKPNIALNFALAFAFGLIAGLSYVYLFPERKYDLRLWPSRRRRMERESARENFSQDYVRDNWKSVSEVLKEREAAGRNCDIEESGRGKNQNTDYETEASEETSAVESEIEQKEVRSPAEEDFRPRGDIRNVF